MSRIPYYEVENATGKHAEFLEKLKPHLNIYRMLANSEYGAKGFVRMGNALLHRCELDPTLRELAILRVGRLSRAAYEVFQHERIAREVGAGTAPDTADRSKLGIARFDSFRLECRFRLGCWAGRWRRRLRP